MNSWLAAVCAGLAVWMWLPADGVLRLRPAQTWHFPGWARPLPVAMESRKRWWIGAVVATGVVMYIGSLSWLTFVVGPTVMVAVWIGLGRMEPGKVKKRRLEALYQLPQALDLLQACVRAGQPLRKAVNTVSGVLGPPVSGLFESVTRAISVGMSDTQAWQVLSTDPVIGFVARDIARSADWGTAITDVLAQHSADLRRQGRAQRLASAKAVGTKSVLPLGLCYLPAFLLVGVVPVVAAGFSGFF